MAAGKQDVNAGAGGDDFPILCESCLGPNPYVRMMKDSWGAACKVCERPFTSFRWRPAGAGMRPKKTEICQNCARAKNICQTCLLDLEYGLPVQVRDASIARQDRQLTVVPKSDGTREYTAAQVERSIANGDIDRVYNAPKINKIAERAKRTQPVYERNRTKVCSFFLRGQCTRGLYCPYRHEKPSVSEDEELKAQSLRDRYYGVNDPVAARILRKAGYSADGSKTRVGNSSGSKVPDAPTDTSIKTLFIGGVKAGLKEEDIRKIFSGVSGVRDTILHSTKGFCFVEFETRKNAEDAMRTCHGTHEIDGVRLQVNWGRGNKRQREPDVPAASYETTESPNVIYSSTGVPEARGERAIAGKEGERAKRPKQDASSCK